MTSDQIKIIHIAAKQLRMDDAAYRLVLANIGGVASSKQLDNEGFEQVMSFMEAGGFRSLDETGRPRPDDYWRKRAKQHGNRAARKIHQLHAMCVAEGAVYELAGMCRNASKGTVEKPEELEPREQMELIEALKEIHRRKRFAKSRESNSGALPTIK